MNLDFVQRSRRWMEKGDGLPNQDPKTEQKE